MPSLFNRSFRAVRILSSSSTIRTVIRLDYPPPGAFINELFRRRTLAAQIRQIAGYGVQRQVQPLHIVSIEAGEYRGLVDLRKIVERVQHGLSSGCQIDAVRTAIARIRLPPEIPFIAQAI